MPWQPVPLREDHRYPFAGEKNPVVKLCVVSAKSNADAAAGAAPAVTCFDLTKSFGEEPSGCRLREAGNWDLQDTYFRVDSIWNRVGQQMLVPRMWAK